MADLKNKCQELGNLGETMFAQAIFKRYGLEAQATSHTHPYDFDLNGLRIEVKISVYSSNGFRANLRGHTKEDYDILIMILADEYLAEPDWIIAPMEEITQKHITIRSFKGKGKFESYLNNWELLEKKLGLKD